MALGTVNDVNYFRRIMRTGARDYLMKPVDADTLGEISSASSNPATACRPRAASSASSAPAAASA